MYRRSHVHMCVRVESPIMCPYERYPTRRTRGKENQEKKKKKLIYVLYEYLSFYLEYTIHYYYIESKVDKKRK